MGRLADRASHLSCRQGSRRCPEHCQLPWGWWQFLPTDGPAGRPAKSRVL